MEMNKKNCIIGILLLLATIGVSSCRLLQKQFWSDEYMVTKISPKGNYQATIVVKAEPTENCGFCSHNERVNLVISKNKEVLYQTEWHDAESFEPSFKEANPRIEWVEEGVFYTGISAAKQPFYDEIVVYNTTNKTIRYISLSYGKSCAFYLLDISPEQKIKLYAPPGFPPNSFLGYGGITLDEDSFNGVVYGKERKSTSDGPLSLLIQIKPEHLRRD
jgi:hypothetical protein